MVIKNLHFFNKSGYDLNFEWNKTRSCWEGNIYLPKVSVGLYANTTIYVLEKIGDKFVFPRKTKYQDKVLFKWDILNKFVDEFFMFTFDTSYVIHDTSALTYEPQDGPNCEPLLINIFDTYSVDLDEEGYIYEYDSDIIDNYSDIEDARALPIHVAFSSPEKYDANTFKRTLVMTCNGRDIARITFFAETIEEDERLKILNQNLGYNITKEDEIIFKESDIKECKPDFELLNRKRKELLIEGDKIYPYVGSYKALINVIKFFGYDNLNVIEYWRNINSLDENFGKIYHSSKYSLTKKETITLNGKNIPLPNKDFRKTNQLALTYNINHPTKEVDIFELPYTKEDFEYTLEEVLIKLFALKNKLNKEFMPGNSRIIDIIGEANYFGLIGIRNNSSFGITKEVMNGKSISIDIFPKKYVNISNNRFFDNFILDERVVDRENNIDTNTILNTISDKSLDEIFKGGKNSIKERKALDYIKSENDICDLYKKFYKEGYENFTTQVDNTEGDLYDYCLDNNISAKVVLKNTSFFNKTFGDAYETFGSVKYNTSFTSIDYDNYRDIEWTIIHSDNQVDEERLELYGVKDEFNKFKKNGAFDYEVISEELRKKYELIYKHQNWQATKFGHISDYDSVYFELPYIGYYDVKVSITDNYNCVSTKIFTKAIKVEPFNLDIRGFYYDARKLPDNIDDNIINMLLFDSDSDSEYDFDDNSIEKFILTKLQYMTSMALQEHYHFNNNDFSMPLWGKYKELIRYNDNNAPTCELDDLKHSFKYQPLDINGNPTNNEDEYQYVLLNLGPYDSTNVGDEWYLADNLNINIGYLKPDLRYVRYIKNGVDVKPYTWMMLGFEQSKIVGKCNPKWTIINTTLNKKYINWYYNNDDEYKNLSLEEKYKQLPTHKGKYLTLLLKQEGDYKVILDVDDINGNHYTLERNIVVVNADANYKLYTSFKNDYDAYISELNMKEEKMLYELSKLNNDITFDLESPY